MAEFSLPQLEAAPCVDALPSDAQRWRHSDVTANITPRTATSEASGQGPHEARSPAAPHVESPEACDPQQQQQQQQLPPPVGVHAHAPDPPPSQECSAKASRPPRMREANSPPVTMSAGRPKHAETGVSAVEDVALESEGEASDGGEAGRADMNAWLYDVLQRVQPGASITVNSLRLLENLFDTLVSRVLSEAQECASEPAVGMEGGSRKRKPATLTSLQIQKAMRRVLPGEPGGRLRPYLPTETKLARQLDKQSLRGLRSKRDNPASNQ